MSNSRFETSRAKGEIWEKKFLKIIDDNMEGTYHLIDNRKVYRDSSNRKKPDFTIHDMFNNKTIHCDAKAKKFYRFKSNDGEFRECFTMDSFCVKDYRSFAKESSQTVYVAFWDEEKDPEHYYILDVMQEEFDTIYYNNEHNRNNHTTYRWERKHLIKRKIKNVDIFSESVV
jgi:hypothetical protein